MRITIEREKLVYIYLIDRGSKIGIVESTMPFVAGNLIHDSEGNWIGIEIEKRGKGYTFEDIKFIDEIDPPSFISVNEDVITLRFEDRNHQNESKQEQGFNIDLIGDAVYGIEMILQIGNDISKRKIPFEMITNEN